MFELEWGLDALAGTTLAPVSRTLSTSLGWGAFFFKELEFHRPRECSLEKQDEQFLELYVICPQEAASSPEGLKFIIEVFAQMIQVGLINRDYTLPTEVSPRS